MGVSRKRFELLEIPNQKEPKRFTQLRGDPIPPVVEKDLKSRSAPIE